MRNSELLNLAITRLLELNETYKIRPKKFTPKEIAEAVGGSYTALGHVALQVERELRARGVQIQYVRIGSRRFFELL